MDRLLPTTMMLLIVTAANNKVVMAIDDEPTQPKSIPLRLVYLMFPEHNDYIHGGGTYPMRDILVDFVNNNKTLLPYYNVSVETYDTGYFVEHNVAKSIRLFTRHVASDCMETNSAALTLAKSCNATALPGEDDKRPVPLFFGPEYSGEAMVISPLANLYNLVQICGGTVAADLSDRTKYPNFFRTVMSGNAFVGLPRALLTYFNYTNVALLPRDLSYADPMQKVDFDLVTHGFNVLFRLKFQVQKKSNDSIDMALDSVLLYDARILMVWSIESDEDRLFCRTIDRWTAAASSDSQLPFNPEKYLVIFVAMLEGASWLEPNAKGLLPKCQHKELSTMLNGSLIAKIPTWSLPTDKLEFGLTNQELIAKAEALGRSRYNHPTGALAPLLPRAVDAIWLGFLGLDALDRRLRAEIPRSRSLLDFTFQSSDIAQMLVEELKKIRFMGTDGLFKYDKNTDVSGQVFVEQYRPGRQASAEDGGEYVRVLRFDTEKGIVQPIPGGRLLFGTKTGLPPPDKKPLPVVPEQSSSLLLVLLTVLCAALIVLASVIATGYFYYRRKVALNLAQPAWLIDFNMLVVHDDATNFSRSSLFGLSVMSGDDRRKSYATMVTNSSVPDGMRTAQLNNESVTLQLLPTEAEQLVLGVRNYKLLNFMHDNLHHDNLVKFYGYCLEPIKPTVLMTVANQYLVWERCDKGSLEQLIDNGTLFNLDAILELAVILDVARGMAYLHSQHSSILRNDGAHGSLCAAACLIDKRFSVKVANYADRQLAEELFGLTTLLAFPIDFNNDERSFYLAPEILREIGTGVTNSKTKTPSSASADVFAYGIIVYALLSRAPPYGSSHSTVEQILDLVKLRPKTGQPFRPSMENMAQTSDANLVSLVQRCWAETPADRPTFATIVNHLQQISGIKAGSSVTDQLLQRLEHYASDMESLVRERTNELEGEKRRSDSLLNAMLPVDIANELKSNGHVQPESYDSVTIYFSDIVGFTTLSSDSTPIQVVNFLNALYTLFDARIDQYDAYKVETIGDAYMVVSGLPRRNGNLHAAEIAKLSLALLCDIESFVIPHRADEKLQLRIGLHTGPCVAGVVGTKMPRYCLFGDTVNTASRMESSGLPSKIHLSDALRQLLDTFGDTFKTEERGPLTIKGKGTMVTYWLDGISINR